MMSTTEAKPVKWRIRYMIDFRNHIAKKKTNSLGHEHNGISQMQTQRGAR